MSFLIAVFLVIFTGLIVLGYWDYSRKARRRATLRKDDDTGYFIWIGFDGCEQRSLVHPDKPGGEWHHESTGSDSSDSGGFD